jgi:octaprenyl-diphosphate synthase
VKDLRSPKFVSAVEQRIADALAWPESGPDPDVLGRAAKHLCLAADARRARPRLVGLFGLAVGSDFDACVDVAVAGEFIHAASLLHDDVIDEGTLRRQQPTANVLWGNLSAVLSGDLVLIQALDVLSDLPRSITDDAHHVIASMTRGALLEAQGRGNPELSLADWHTIATYKTGTLLGWCGKAAARLGGDSTAVARFDTCGLHLGIAYQLADDLRDLCGGDDSKDRFADIRNANPSYPVLWACAQSPRLRERLKAFWLEEGTDPHELGQEVTSTGAIDATVEAIQAEAKAGIEALGDYASGPGGLEIAAWIEQLVFASRAAA